MVALLVGAGGLQPTYQKWYHQNFSRYSPFSMHSLSRLEFWLTDRQT